MTTKGRALYAGSFDPLTMGHVDMIERAAKMFDYVYVAVATNTTKTSLFTGEEKLVLAQEATQHLDNVEVIYLKSGLTVNFARELDCGILIRGLRNGSDFEQETNIALMNKHQAPDIETVLLLSSEKYRFVSSSIIKEVAKFNGDISGVVPPNVNEAIKAKYAELNG
ncbi:Phosphopantetheine adenylyltransferase [Aerococcus viridans]|uniref:Phosphopantetheine adenylyltransferase n=2 Tax=Aerococcus viridans TaxID=1377 RepID=A0AAU8U5I4_9LACT|nr:pantetheine-phosphate adenylyltransferase [Aerococcus viridans]AMC01426.1 phosphopantetheine adenylyltransferase [Aerococcus viridans]EFG48803.1 pantetheine-phosphate adenylyltransferase [Aerococcus viridans ATCC 11563 = CCUG 4311]SUU15373.1 Phosphopantetheine adenylyltransferase [Aerococcus viridans]